MFGFSKLDDVVLSVGVSFAQVQEYWSPQLQHLQRRQTGTERETESWRDESKDGASSNVEDRGTE